MIQPLTEAEIVALKRDMRESLADMQAALRQRRARVDQGKEKAGVAPA